ncbi:MAG: cupin domain-containing protein [Turicibacter sp.]|nr:cupin domain-containing protein [Turicibacter sp.]
MSEHHVFNGQSFRAPQPRPSVDHGPMPFTLNIEQATKKNPNYRVVLWTGKHLQTTLMTIPVGGDIGLEVHHDHDQFLRIEDGKGLVQMGDGEKNLTFQQAVEDGYAICVPAGTWHNVTNTGQEPLKLYSIYAPPEHPPGAIHETKAIAEAAEARYRGTVY